MVEAKKQTKGKQPAAQAEEAAGGMKKLNRLKQMEAEMQEQFDEQKLYEAGPTKGCEKMSFEAKQDAKFMATFPYPYMNGYLHLGKCISACIQASYIEEESVYSLSLMQGTDSRCLRPSSQPDTSARLAKMSSSHSDSTAPASLSQPPLSDSGERSPTMQHPATSPRQQNSKNTRRRTLTTNPHRAPSSRS